MRGVEVSLDHIGVSIFNAHHSVNTEELDVCLVLIIEANHYAYVIALFSVSCL
jgi:hypothetical protein